MAPTKLINLTRGVPPVDVFPTEDLIDCFDASLRRDADVLLQYGRAGYPPLRQWLGARYGVNAERVLTSNSSLELFTFITQALLTPGERAFVESPTYDRAITLLRRTGAEVVGIPLEKDGVDLEALETALQRGAPVLMYIIADFQNPMGVTTSLEKRKRLVELAEQYDFWIVEDAPYRQLRYWGENIPSLHAIAPDRVLHVSSFSKILSPGLRLGYVIGPEEAIARFSQWALDSYIGPVLPTQGMVYEYCRRGLLDKNIEHLKTLYRPRLETVRAALHEHIPQATWTEPEGGFFISGDLPEHCDIANLIQQGHKVGLKLSNGRGFFPNPENGERFLRIPFCSLTPEEIEEGVKRLASIV